jgi:hypothetical protein
MARPRTEESKIKETLLTAKPPGLSWKQIQEETKLPKSTVTTILHRMIRESNAVAKMEDRNGRPTPVYHYKPRPHWGNPKHRTKDTGNSLNVKVDSRGKLTDVEYVTESKRLAPSAKLGGDMYSHVKRRVKVPRERWNTMISLSK